jgi:hypothetical protein
MVARPSAPMLRILKPTVERAGLRATLKILKERGSPRRLDHPFWLSHRAFWCVGLSQLGDRSTPEERVRPNCRARSLTVKLFLTPIKKPARFQGWRLPSSPLSVSRIRQCSSLPNLVKEHF